ncbi:MAG: aspartate dehydrogenase [Methanobacteriota archaeon]
MKIGLIGCGNLGGFIAKAVDEGEIHGTRLVCVYDKNRLNSDKLVKTLKNKPNILADYMEFSKYNLDLVIEAASQKAVRECILNILQNRVNVMVMSVGALLDENMIKKVLDTCEKQGVNVYVPSGAVAGLDGVKAACTGQVYEVRLHSIKPIKSLEGNKYLESEGIDLNSITEEKIVFDGLAMDAVHAFPKSINVCAALSLSGVGASKTHVRISVDPNVERIRHKITVKGDFGELTTEVNNVPSPNNPKTSYLAALSAIRMIKTLSGEHLHIGT